MRIVVCDFEYGRDELGLPDIRCGVFMDHGGQIHRFWIDDLQKYKVCPLPLNSDTVLVCYYAIAEMSCFDKLGWPPPLNLIDLFVEFSMRVNINGIRLRKGLTDALSYFNIQANYMEKKTMRQLALRGPPYSDFEKQELLEYCTQDVIATRSIMRELCGI